MISTEWFIYIQNAWEREWENYVCRLAVKEENYPGKKEWKDETIIGIHIGYIIKYKQ